ncbi:MAG: hypothetical protein HY369_00345 [Candidatus Aenigmarchaeota archaeon]|nr:hypothetical protein [Candidatus Aenigmarchaeota archaeon]
MKGLLLLSGGIDSPVAGSLLQKDMDLEAVHFSFAPLTNDEPEEKCRALAGKLGIRLHVINIASDLQRIAQLCDRKYYFVLMKRLMLRRAEALAKKQGCDVLVTGESLGQVSSQTVDNLRAIDAATGMTVLRPLIAMDKEEIIKIAERIGTFAVSCGKEMCDVLGPDHPETRARLADVERQEQQLAAAQDK